MNGVYRRGFLCWLALLGANAMAQDDEDQDKRCAQTLQECASDGCAAPGTPKSLLNNLKRTTPSGNSPATLTLDDFLGLQDAATERVGQGRALSAHDREQLRDLPLRSGTAKVSEGDLVEVSGYLIGLPDRPKASGPESVNCRMSGSANNDYHIPIGSDPDSTEFDGIVVEMIPQHRDSGWTVRKLRRIAREHRLVVVEGQLLYDNPHRVNEDPDNVLSNQPKRASLWEIHPVTRMYVCMTAVETCNPKNIRTQQWMRLEAIKE